MYIFTKDMQANRLTKMFGPKIIKDFWKIIRMTQACYLCPSKNVGKDDRRW